LRGCVDPLSGGGPPPRRPVPAWPGVKNTAARAGRGAGANRMRMTTHRAVVLRPGRRESFAETGTGGRMHRVTVSHGCSAGVQQRVASRPQPPRRPAGPAGFTQLLQPGGAGLPALPPIDPRSMSSAPAYLPGERMASCLPSPRPRGPRSHRFSMVVFGFGREKKKTPPPGGGGGPPPPPGPARGFFSGGVSCEASGGRR